MEFDKHYRPAGSAAPQDISHLVHTKVGARGLGEFLAGHAGRSFEGGLYRIHPVDEMARWTSIVGEAFPDFKQRVLCFSYDWLGRHFALDFRRLEGDQYLVLMLEPGTGQALEIPATFRDFHERELIEFRSEALASDFYQSWLSSGRPQPNLSECVGYRKPLFLGGEDVLNNLELVDMEVYWSVCGQLLARVRRMPEGSSIRNIRIEDKI